MTTVWIALSSSSVPSDAEILFNVALTARCSSVLAVNLCRSYCIEIFPRPALKNILKIPAVSQHGLSRDPRAIAGLCPVAHKTAGRTIGRAKVMHCVIRWCVEVDLKGVCPRWRHFDYCCLFRTALVVIVVIAESSLPHCSFCETRTKYPLRPKLQQRLEKQEHNTK